MYRLPSCPILADCCRARLAGIAPNIGRGCLQEGGVVHYSENHDGGSDARICHFFKNGIHAGIHGNASFQHPDKKAEKHPSNQVNVSPHVSQENL